MYRKDKVISLYPEKKVIFFLNFIALIYSKLKKINFQKLKNLRKKCQKKEVFWAKMQLW